MLKCYIIDDEQHSIDAISNYIEKMPNMCVIGSNISPIFALDEIRNTNRPHIVFLDIEMPELSGLDVADLLPSEIAVIIITGHTHYALKAFEKNALGFLLKPFSFEMFAKSINKMNIMLEKLQSISKATEQEKLFVKSGAKNKLIQLNVNSIFLIEALDHYVTIHTQDESHVVHVTMSTIANKLPRVTFIRIHKTFIVNLDKIKSIEYNQVVLDNGSKIPCGGELYRKSFLEIIHSKTIKK